MARRGPVFSPFAFLFLILPTLQIVTGAFRTPAGDFTLANVANLFTPSILSAYWISIRISVASAFFGCLIGFPDGDGHHHRRASELDPGRRS